MDAICIGQRTIQYLASDGSALEGRLYASSDLMHNDPYEKIEEMQAERDEARNVARRLLAERDAARADNAAWKAEYERVEGTHNALCSENRRLSALLASVEPELRRRCATDSDMIRIDAMRAGFNSSAAEIQVDAAALRNLADALEAWRKEAAGYGTLTDGFGSTWPARCPNCGAAMQVVRPGDCRCSAECGEEAQP